jgi:DNA helicase-2/ATP-dependent DNA helicase PcrA
VIKKVPGSPEQEAIWEAMQPRNKYHMVVNARAGTGKTFSMVQGILRLPKTLRIAFVAFNKHIANEAQQKLNAAGCSNVTCCTYHSLGYRMVRGKFPTVRISETKNDDIMEGLPVPSGLYPNDWHSVVGTAGKLAGLAKNYLLSPDDVNFQDCLEDLADHHSIDLNGVGRWALEFVPRLLEESKRRASYLIDYDDMIWLPAVLNLSPLTEYDYLIVDEAQDTNRAQQELALRCCPQGRIIIVGDRFQAIYGFRGADVSAMSSMKERLAQTPRGVSEFPLTITRRCPKSHVRLAQGIVKDIRPMDDAPEGEVLMMEYSQAVTEMLPGDMVLCRTGKPLIPTAYALISRGIRPIIRGREIGKGLLDLLSKLEKKAFDLPQISYRLLEYQRKEESRLSALGTRASSRLMALQDRCECLFELIQQSSSISEVRNRIETLFSDVEGGDVSQNSVVLGTVHRTKGLEASRVFVLSPELLPHPLARLPWEQEQERNLAYVAATRCKYTKSSPGTLIFCGALPGIYGKEATLSKSAN